jgi:hypothetical protein
MTSYQALERLGADTRVMNDDFTGLDINVKCGSTNLEPLKGLVAEVGADVGIAHDGDADRVMLVDSRGREIDGDMMEYELKAGQQMIVDTGYVAGFESSVSIDIQQVKGMKNKLLGGEGFFNTVLTGPGRIWLQTMPIPGVAGAIQPYIVTAS